MDTGRATGSAATGSAATGRPAVKAPFEAVVEQHGPTVLRVCRVLLAQHDAEDAWAETFLAALRAYPQLPADANVQAWLVTIARRKAIDLLRAAKRAAVPVGAVPDTVICPATPGAGDPDVWEAVGRLPDRQRLVVAYRYAAGLSYAEIAEILGGRVDAARRAAADGLKNLRRRYAGTNSTDQPDATGGADPRGALR
jgi:DNA-directed RNA polymerase specialized sigma24 family protein